MENIINQTQVKSAGLPKLWDSFLGILSYILYSLFILLPASAFFSDYLKTQLDTLRHFYEDSWGGHILLVIVTILPPLLLYCYFFRSKRAMITKTFLFLTIMFSFLILFGSSSHGLEAVGVVFLAPFFPFLTWPIMIVIGIIFNKIYQVEKQ